MAGFDDFLSWAKGHESVIALSIDDQSAAFLWRGLAEQAHPVTVRASPASGDLFVTMQFGNDEPDTRADAWMLERNELLDGPRFFVRPAENAQRRAWIALPVHDGRFDEAVGALADMQLLLLTEPALRALIGTHLSAEHLIEQCRKVMRSSLGVFNSTHRIVRELDFPEEILSDPDTQAEFDHLKRVCRSHAESTLKLVYGLLDSPMLVDLLADQGADLEVFAEAILTVSRELIKVSESTTIPSARDVLDLTPSDAAALFDSPQLEAFRFRAPN